MTEDSKVPRWTRHLEGWQGGLLVLLIAGGSILLAVPRGVPALEFPPVVGGVAAAHDAFEADRSLARKVASQPLDVDVRHLGREMRSYNLAAAKGELDNLAEARARLARAAVKAHAVAGAQAIRRLRAVQTMRFIDELRLWQRSGKSSKELMALGGDIVPMLQRNRWCRGDGQLLLDNAMLRIMYQLRWTQLSTIRDPKLEPSREEQRLRYLFLLRHPFASDDSGLSRQANEARVERQAVKHRLRTIRRLVQHMPDYPASLARGVTYYRAGMWAGAATAFNEHMTLRPDGPYRLRAQNYLKAALDRVNGSSR